MAFETIRGESGVDFIGTDGVDILFAINENGITVDAKGGNDNVDLTNETGVIGNAEVKLGEGADIFTVGNSSTDNNRLVDSVVNGGPGNDDLSPEGAVSTKMRGNEGNDDFFLLGNYTSTTLNGNSGEDSFDLAGNVVLSNAKITGGANNDGQMDFDSQVVGADFTILAADSVITGAKGNDQIDIGAIAAGSIGLRVSGGEGNDVINVNNDIDAATNVNYNGAKGQDTFNFLAANAADATSKGGDDADIYNFVGAGEITSAGEAGADTFGINAVGAGDQNMTGGEGGDTLNFLDATEGDHTWVINSISESNIAGHDVFGNELTDFAAGAEFVIDLSSNGTGETLVGNRLVSGTEAATDAGVDGVGQPNNIIDVADEDNIAGIISDVNANGGGLTGSVSDLGDANDNLGQINVQAINVAAGDAAGVYIVLNNNNTILDGGDILFETALAGGSGDVAVDAEIDAFVTAINAGY